MPRFSIRKDSIAEDEGMLRGTISQSEYLHITKVLRLGVGDRIIVFDNESTEYKGIIENISSEFIAIRIQSSSSVETESALKLYLFQAILKGNKMDDVIRQATQLGVSRIFPVISERTQIRRTAKVERWNKIAVESTKQCGRTRPPEVSRPIVFHNFGEIKKRSEMKIMLYENETELLGTYINSRSKPVNSVNVFIGPEGGFSEKEISEAKKNGYAVLGLGKRILRAETASIASLALLQSRFGDI